MDTAAFIITLAAFFAVAAWYAGNEMRKAGGRHGVLGVKVEADETGDETLVADETKARYRTRARLAPPPVSGARTARTGAAQAGAAQTGAAQTGPAAPARSYAAKDAEAPAFRKRMRFGEKPLDDL